MCVCERRRNHLTWTLLVPPAEVDHLLKVEGARNAQLILIPHPPKHLTTLL